jgi:Raf kinase inhibitor-like YbhB/YbcL family protein
MTLTLSSSVFTNMGELPSKYTCNGSDVSPPLQWDGVPENTSSLVLIVDDPDAPDPKAPKMTWVHWLVFNIPPDARSFAEAVSSVALPKGAQQGINDWKSIGYRGPCPPIGRHRYFFKLYALDALLNELNNVTKPQLEAAMQGHVIAKAELVGTYQQ